MKTMLTVHGFAATQTDEGLVVHDVPIFCVCERGEVEFTEAWIKAAVTKAFRRQKEGYCPPMHVKHHEPDTSRNDSVRAAGHFKITGTTPLQIGGVLRTAVVADLVFTDSEAALETLKGQLPYRSVEIFDVEREPSIDSLALLDHEAPFLELPMLKVGQVAEQRTVDGVAGATLGERGVTSDPRFMVAFSRHGNHVELAFRQDQNMAAPKTKAKKAKTETAADKADKTVNFADHGDDDKKDKSEHMADDDDDHDGKGEKMQGDEGLDVSAVVKAIASGEISVADMTEITAAISAQGATEEPAEDEVAPAPAPIESMKADQQNLTAFAMAQAKVNAKLQGKVDALEANEVNRDKSTKRDDEVAEAYELLRELPLGSDVKGLLFRYHKAHGGAAFSDYVESLKHNVAVEPGERSDTDANFAALGGKFPDVAMKYQDEGTERVQQAAKFSVEYDQLMEAGSGMKTTRESYVKRNMAKAG